MQESVGVDDESLSDEENSALERIVGLFSAWARKNPGEFRSIVRDSLDPDRFDRPPPADLSTSGLASASG